MAGVGQDHLTGGGVVAPADHRHEHAPGGMLAEFLIDYAHDRGWRIHGLGKAVVQRARSRHQRGGFGLQVTHETVERGGKGFVDVERAGEIPHDALQVGQQLGGVLWIEGGHRVPWLVRGRGQEYVNCAESCTFLH